jgi:hypothetical protein
MIVVSPVKNSLATTKETIKHIFEAEGQFSYFIFNDYSDAETKNWLTANEKNFNFKLLNLEDLVNTPSPNYITVLRMAQKMALEQNTHLLVIESDVLIEKHTIMGLEKLANTLNNVGMIGSVTVDQNGEINFPYRHIKKNDGDLFITKRSLSFCCTVLCNKFLQKYDFETLNPEKDWFDVSITKMSRHLGFENYLSNELSVIHLPHSSRPWKNEKYSNPISYYFKKYLFRRDKI